MTENNILFKSQHGFRSNHLTEIDAIEFIEHIKSEISLKHTPISIFLDLSHPFDTVDHNILLKKLTHYGFIGSELKWFESYLFKNVNFCSKMSTFIHKCQLLFKNVNFSLKMSTIIQKCQLLFKNVNFYS